MSSRSLWLSKVDELERGVHGQPDGGPGVPGAMPVGRLLAVVGTVRLGLVEECAAMAVADVVRDDRWASRSAWRSSHQDPRSGVGPMSSLPWTGGGGSASSDGPRSSMWRHSPPRVFATCLPHQLS